MKISRGLADRNCRHRKNQISLPNRTRRADFDEEDEDFKDVYYPDFEEVLGETSAIFQLRYAFACGGFHVIKAEEASTHPVLIIKAVRNDSTRLHSDLLFQHIRILLRNAGFPLKRYELTVDQTGKQILVVLPWAHSRIDYAAALREAESEAAEFEGMAP